MRLAALSHRHALPQKLVLLMIRITTGHRPLDVVRTLFYRYGYFGRHQQTLTRSVLRGESEWQVWEREVMAAFVSKLNQCRF